MKKVNLTLSYRVAPKLTDMVRTLQQAKLQQGVRPAQSGSGDTVYWIRSSKTGFTVDYCVKTAPNGSLFVNWARVYGTEEDVTRFCIACEHYDYIVLSQAEEIVIPVL